LTTRTFFYGDKEVLVPIVDLANHDNACQHTHRLEPCDPDLGLKQRSESLLPPPVPPSFASGVVVPVEGATPDADVQSRGVSGVCLVWRAESPVAMGMEVCNNYGLLLQDNSMLQYGYLQVSGLPFLLPGGEWVGGWNARFSSGVAVLVEGAAPDDAVRSRGVSGVCLVWRAESPVAMGMEVCNNYSLLLQDNALLQYGYLQVRL
jgi:hypothetical protein